MVDKDPFAGMDFSDEDEYNPQEGTTIKQIVLMHIKKISGLCCQEFTAGYWSKKPIKTQSGVLYTETYHDDVQEAYCNSIDFLIDLLYPEGDEDFKKFIDDNKHLEIEELDKKEKFKKKRKAFQEINKMFERIGYWASQGVSNE